MYRSKDKSIWLLDCLRILIAQAIVSTTVPHTLVRHVLSTGISLSDKMRADAWI